MNGNGGNHYSGPSERNQRKLIGIVVVIAFVVGLLLVMGFLKQFFSHKTGNSETTAQNTIVASHQEDWVAYLSTIDDDKVGAIVVDLGLKPITPVKDRLNRLRIDITMKFPGPNGLPLPQEFETLNSIDEKLTSSLATKNGAVYAGHLNCQGKLSLYHYLDNAALFEPTISETMAAFPDYKYEYRVDREEHWKSYTELLYPLPIQMQSIHNQKVVEQLKSQGDKLEKVRPVNHLIYFKNESDLEHFLAEIKGKGFKVQKKEPVDDGEYKMILSLERNDPVDLQSVDDYVLYLWQKAQDAHGDYDGWGSSIVKE